MTEVISMSEIEFSITVNMYLNLEGDMAKLSIRNVDLKPAVITLPAQLSVEARHTEIGHAKKKTLHEIVLDTARKYVAETGRTEFTAAELFHLAREKYHNLKRNSFGAHVIAGAPNHSSWKHYPNKKHYLFYVGNGKYNLKKGGQNEK